MIKHDEMVKALAKDGDTIVAQMTGNEAHLLHMALGISGEVAELVEGLSMDASVEAIRENVIEELGDLEFYAEGMRQGLDLPVIAPRDLTPEEKAEPAPKLVRATVILAGNFLDTIKRRVIYRKELDLEKATKELNQLHYYMAHFRAEFGLTRAEVIQGNIAKLGKRYEGLKYSDTAAQERADKSA